MDSIFRKPPLTRRTGAPKSGSNLLDGGQIKIDLPLDFLVTEHRVLVELTQQFLTVVPTGSDVRRAFSKVELTSNEGTIFTGDFYQIYDHSRFTETTGTPIITLSGISKAVFNFELHHINDVSKLDLLTALKTNAISSLQLVLTLNPDASNVFTGGGTPQNVTAIVRVQGREYPTLTNDQSMGIASHQFKHLAERVGTAAAGEFEVNLKAGGRVRFLFVHTFDATTGLPSNTVLDKFNLSIGGVEVIKNETFEDIQQDNSMQRRFYVAGVAVIDFGDDPAGWPNITGDMGEVKLNFTSRQGAPASWKARISQDWTSGLEKVGIAL